MTDDSRTPTASLTLELLAGVDPTMRWRITAGPYHACGPTIEAVVHTIEQAMGAAN